jgi:hypothetical protein
MDSATIQHDFDWVQRFEENFALMKKNHKTFRELIEIIIQEKRIYPEVFCVKNDLSRMAFTRLKKRIIPTLKTLVAFCVAFEIDMPNVNTLLQSTGYSFKLTDRVHYAYQQLILYHSREKHL